MIQSSQVAQGPGGRADSSWMCLRQYLMICYQVTGLCCFD